MKILIAIIALMLAVQACGQVYEIPKYDAVVVEEPKTVTQVGESKVVAVNTVSTYLLIKQGILKDIKLKEERNPVGLMTFEATIDNTYYPEIRLSYCLRTFDVGESYMYLKNKNVATDQQLWRTKDVETQERLNRMIIIR